MASKKPSGLPTNIGSPARRALEAAGFHSLAQLTAVSEEHLKALHGVGPKALTRLREALEAEGLSFAPRK
jgi:DNA-directed RNA polymerase alpha subunit